MFKVEMSTDNAAFHEDGYQGDTRPTEIGRILRDVVEAMEAGETSGNCRDGNGNTVGKWSLT
jgi:hypothetical protein